MVVVFSLIQKNNHNIYSEAVDIQVVELAAALWPFLGSIMFAFVVADGEGNL